MSRKWVIAARPLGRALALEDFRLEPDEGGEPRANEVQVETLYLGMDPAQKSWMENLAGYAAATEIGDVMPGSGVGRVRRSKSVSFKEGDLVGGPLGWRENAVIAADKLEHVAENAAPTAALGVLGMVGRTAYFGLFEIGKPRAGDVVVISGAAGAVGSIVGQLAKIAGCTVIGIAGGAKKCAWLTQELGFDAAIDYKSEKLRARLRELAPKGVDIFFDNVGGDILDDALTRLAFGARVVICGGISRYNADPRNPAQMPPGPRNYFNLVATQATIQGFLVHQFKDRYPIADARLAGWLKTGALKQHEDILDGFEHAPQALIRLYAGANRGKQIVRVGASHEG